MFRFLSLALGRAEGRIFKKKKGLTETFLELMMFAAVIRISRSFPTERKTRHVNTINTKCPFWIKLNIGKSLFFLSQNMMENFSTNNSGIANKTLDDGLCHHNTVFENENTPHLLS